MVRREPGLVRYSLLSTSSTAAKVPLWADVLSAIAIANICPRHAKAPARSAVATIVSTRENPASDVNLLEADFSKAVHLNGLG